MIILVTGKIGGGKTYFCVNYLVEKFYEYKESIFQYVPNRKNLRIITNIRSLELPHEDLDELLDKKGVVEIFNPKFVGEDQCVFIIDEAQRIFDRKFHNVDVFAFFQMSRHYGCDILLITQDVNTLARELKFLCEYEIRAVARSKRTTNTFVYQFLSDDEIFKRQIIRLNKRVGALYKSQFRKETEKVPKVWKNYVIIAGVCLVLVFVGFKMAISAYRGLGGKYTTKINNPKFIGETLPGTVPDPVTPIEIESHEVDKNYTVVQVEDVEKVKTVPDPVQSKPGDGNKDERNYFSDLKKEYESYSDEERKKGKTYVNQSGRVTGYVVFH
jgi:hypothetical protein